MIKYFGLVFSVTSVFCSLPPDCTYRHMESNSGYYNHWQDVDSRPATPESARQQERNVQQQEHPVQQRDNQSQVEVSSLLLPIRAFGTIGSSPASNNNAAGVASSIIIRIPSYRSLSGDNSPISPTKAISSK